MGKFELKGSQVEEFREALSRAFTEDRLKQMLRLRLDWHWDKIKNGETYEDRLFNLIELAESQGRLRELVIAASSTESRNSHLERFVKENLQALLEIDSNSLSTDLLSSLIQCLNSIVDFESVIYSCLQILPDEVSLTNENTLKKQLLNNDLSATVKWLIVLEILLISCNGKNTDGYLYIILFVEKLRDRQTSDYNKNQLTKWLNYLPPELQRTRTVSKQLTSLSRPPNEALKNLQAYFLITVEPPEITTQTGKFGINAYVISRVGNDNELTRLQVITLQAPPDDNSTETIELRQQKKGLFCTLQQIEDYLENYLPDWLLQVQEVIANRCTELQTEFSLDFRPVYDLTVEFWLPFEHLTAAADTWKVYGKPVRLKRRNLVVGKEYRVVVRSYDRFSDPDALNELNRTWQNLNDVLQKPSDLSSVQQKFEHVDCWERLTAIQQQLVSQSFLLGLTLTCPLCLDQYQKQRENLFAWILEVGIPVALWSRCSDLANLQEKMHNLLTADTLCQLELLEDKLLEQIKKTREEANDEQPLGHHLAIWCDEPKRLIELKQFLETGRLSA